MSFIAHTIAATRLALKANAPTIMVVGGVASMGAGTVLASIKTLKVEEILVPHVETLDKIKSVEPLQLEGYNADVARADRLKVYARITVDLGKLYAVSGVFLFGGAALIFGGHRIMLQRNATLAIAYTGLFKSFEAYRERVAKSLGDQAEATIYRGSVIDLTNDGPGEVAILSGVEEEHPYNRVFEQGASESWENDLGVNRMFLTMQRKFAQERLSRRGHLYLSDVYEALGFPETPTSRVTGWKVRTLPDGSKDIPFVDFGLDTPYFDDYKWSGQNAIYLDFNCQGLIVGGKVQKALEAL